MISLFGCSSTKDLFRRSPASNPNELVVRRDLYVHQLRGMWVLESMAWASLAHSKATAIYLRDPWVSDHRIAYKHALVYHMSLNGGNLVVEKFLPQLQAAELADARGLELFGALAPALHPHALKIVQPLLDGKSSFVQDTERFRIILFSLGQLSPSYLSLEDRLLWLVRESQKRMGPSTELDQTINLVTELIRQHCPANAELGCQAWSQALADFQTLAKTRNFEPEKIRFASALLAFLVGGGDIVSTLRVGKDLDPAAYEDVAAWMGLIGLMQGYDWVKAHFPKHRLSDRISIKSASKMGFHDQLPGDPQAEDSFLMLSIRMMSSVEKIFKEGGGFLRGPEFVAPLVHIAPSDKSF